MTDKVFIWVWWYGDIAKQEVFKETDKCIFLGDSKSTRHSRIDKDQEGRKFWRTFKDAIEHKRTYLENSLRSCRESLSSAEGKIASFNLQWPKDTETYKEVDRF